MAEQKNVQEQDINQLIKVRQDKLKELQENGKDPFQITKYDVTHHSTEIKENYDVIIPGHSDIIDKNNLCNSPLQFRIF